MYYMYISSDEVKSSVIVTDARLSLFIMSYVTWGHGGSADGQTIRCDL